jgi:hypothetical protein
LGRFPIVPSLSAAGLGRFRIYVGIALLWLLAREEPSALPVEFHRNYSPLADIGLVHLLAATPSAWRAVQMAGVVAAVCFIAGWWTRVAYAVLVAALLLTRLAWLQSSGVHDWVCPTAILLTLLIVPWGDGSSLDQWRKRTVPPDARDPRYGFAIFAPVFIVGLAFAAAAYAKLSVSGLDWVTTGAVRYHFVEDAENAATTWGLWVAARPWAAILLSAAAVTLEATWIAAITLRGPFTRVLAAAAALGLFFGFYVFQGALWLPWAMWVGALLPWDGWRPLAVAPLGGRMAAATSAALAVQLIASLGPIEIEPIMSPYQMYSGTYASPRDFETVRYRKFQQVKLASGGSEMEIGGEAADGLAASIDTGVLDEDASKAVAAVCRTGGTPTVDLQVRRATLDWAASRVETRWVTAERSLPCSRQD